MQSLISLTYFFTGFLSFFFFVIFKFVLKTLLSQMAVDRNLCPFLRQCNLIPSRKAMSGHFDCQILNSIISYDKYPVQRVVHLLCQDFFLKNEIIPEDLPRRNRKKPPLSSELDHLDSLLADAGELCSAALSCATLLRGIKTASVK